MKKSYNFMRILYIGFTLFGIYRLILSNYSEAAMNFGIALAFDPFDPAQPWNKRPLWQKVWLLIHLGICAACLGFEIGTDSK